MIETEVNTIRVSLMNQQRIVVLKDINSERYLPIFIGQFESEAITVELQNGKSFQRPLTHDLLRAVIEEMGGTIEYILVNDLRAETFYARIVIDIDGNKTEVDSRPSDAIALAVRARAPIFVSESVMERSAVVPEEDIQNTLGMDDEDEVVEDLLPELFDDDGDDPVDEDDPEEVVDDSKLSAFADFVNNSLDLDELDDEDK